MHWQDKSDKNGRGCSSESSVQGACKRDATVLGASQVMAMVPWAFRHPTLAPEAPSLIAPGTHTSTPTRMDLLLTIYNGLDESRCHSWLGWRAGSAG